MMRARKLATPCWPLWRTRRADDTAVMSRARREQATQDVLAARSPFVLRFFGGLFARDLRRSFHAVRLSGTLPDLPGPLVIFANHPSWWDGEIFTWLTATAFAGWHTFAPIDSAMLERYPFFRKLGAFGVTPGHAGASIFLDVAAAVLARDNGLLLVNAEGRFRDVRQRPLQFAPGLTHLAKRAPGARFVPLAIEYAFWDERRPNLLLRFGEAVPADAIGVTRGAVLGESLAATMDALAVDALARDPVRFTTMLGGRTRIDPIYDAWRRAKALIRGRRFDPAHGARRDTKTR